MYMLCFKFENGSIFDLCFSYTEEPPYLLNHLSLDIPAGAYWSVVGPNGAG